MLAIGKTRWSSKDRDVETKETHIWVSRVREARAHVCKGIHRGEVSDEEAQEGLQLFP